MGNEIQCGPCADINPDLYLRGFGDIKYISSDNKDRRILCFYDSITDKDEENLKKKQNVMIEIMTKNDTFIVKPHHIDSITYRGFWIFKRYYFRMYYDNYIYNLTSYAKDNLKSNIIVPEIQIMHCIACVTHALLTLKQRSVRHMNISSDTIFMDPFGNWLICPPKHENINLLIRSKAQKKQDGNSDEYDFVEYCMAPEMTSDVESYDTWKADLYSLGVCAVHAIFPFKLDEMKSKLSPECIQKKLTYINNYYSPFLQKIIAGMLETNPVDRTSVEELGKFFIDLQNAKSLHKYFN